MANQSIYDEKWIDLVFENRNKRYGAYQLRQEHPKTTLKALGIGVLLIMFLVSIPLIVGKFGTKTAETTSKIPVIQTIKMSTVVFPPTLPQKREAIAPLTQKKQTKPKPEVNKTNLIDPIVTEAQNAKIEIATNEEAQENYEEPIEGAISGTSNGGAIGGLGTNTKPETNGAEEGTHIAVALDKQPAFPGGMNKFYSYIAENFKTPEADLSKTIKVYVSFVIEKDGAMTDIQVLQNPGYGLDREAIRVLKSLKTKWTPGILKGKPVRTAYNLPIIVKQQ